MRSSLHFAHTILLFTYSDVKTILVPVTVFGTMAAPSPITYKVLLTRIAWVWVNLLHFDVANQSLRPDEDAANKPWRPIPSKRISQPHARMLRWALLPTSIALSFVCQVPLEGLMLSAAFLFNNDLGHDSHWLSRAMLNAVGYTCFNAGASRVMHRMYRTLSSSPYCLNSLVIMTTIQAQDFQDVEGDTTAGRWTLPMAYPTASRLSMVILLPAWSLFLSYFWKTEVIHSVLVLGLSLYIGICFHSGMLKGFKTKDCESYRLYNVWICCIHALPFLPKFPLQAL
ncbi:hypothetical protein C8Q74DRAFT_1318229 [Fomes fomentarius]|nr:hypothetical protein C8Q74DRAFT_1318229 [Fomes fomentarius]